MNGTNMANVPVVIRKNNEQGETALWFAKGVIVLREEQIEGKTVYISELEEKIPTELPESHGKKWTNVCVKGENLFLYDPSYTMVKKGITHYYEGDLPLTGILWCNKGKDDGGLQKLKFIEEYPYLEKPDDGNIQMIGQREIYRTTRVLHKKCREKDIIFKVREYDAKISGYYSEAQDNWIFFEEALSDVGVFYMENSLRFCDTKSGNVYDEDGRKIKS